MQKLFKIAENNCEQLRNAYYTGRTIIIGISPDQKNIIQVYWTVGRSENSKNRHIIKSRDQIKTEPIYKDENMLYPELLIYSISRQLNNYHIISNGTQTDVIYDYLSKNKSFEDAMEVLSFEHDEPIFTPRISAIVNLNGNCVNYKFGIIKTVDQNPNYVLKHVFSYNNSIPGIGYCINTYDYGNECKPFNGEPYYVTLFDDIDTLTKFYWEIIPIDKRVGLYAKYINIEKGTIEERIINERN
jgi:IMP cyclohydrolase